jgi:hypothetical protein
LYDAIIQYQSLSAPAIFPWPRIRRFSSPESESWMGSAMKYCEMFPRSIALMSPSADFAGWVRRTNESADGGMDMGWAKAALSSEKTRGPGVSAKEWAQASSATATAIGNRFNLNILTASATKAYSYRAFRVKLERTRFGRAKALASGRKVGLQPRPARRDKDKAVAARESLFNAPPAL